MNFNHYDAILQTYYYIGSTTAQRKHYT